MVAEVVIEWVIVIELWYYKEEVPNSMNLDYSRRESPTCASKGSTL